ncbi:hypothetical protein L7F22_030737 [Adiantum nelumboides]|nr:hypothetical protein [Adiantum nelumboides]
MAEQKFEEKQGETPVSETKVEDVKEEVGVPAIKEKGEAKKPSNDDGDDEEGKKVEAEAEAEGVLPSEPLTETPSFKEESYSVGDLTDSEKKALEAFRQKVEEAIKSKSIFKKPKKKVEEKAVSESLAPVDPETPVSVEPESLAVDEAEAKDTEVPAITEEPISLPPVEEAPIDSTDPSTPVAEKREILIEEPPVPPIEEGPKNFYIWGIPIHEGDDKTDALLLKFLRARHFKVDDTLAMLKSTVKWRREFNADNIEEEEIEGTEDYKKWAFLHGIDKEGHPVCYNRNVFHNKEVCEKTQFNKFLRWRVQMMEQSIKTHLDFTPGGVQSFIQVIDLQNSPGLLKGAQAMKKFISLLQDNYPELATKQIVLNMPWWYYPALYRLFKMEPKVVSAGPGKSTETLFKYIAPDQVPTEYGGLSRPNDVDFDGVEAPATQMTMKAGEKQSLELPIEEVGSTLIWDISIVGGDVVYGEEFVPDTYTVIIRKPQKLPSTTEPIRNSFKAGEAGKVVITIDNSASKKKKIVVYRSTIKRTASE